MLLRSRGSMAEAAVTLPIIMLATLALVNLAIAGFVAVNANNAANYGARLGATAQSNPAAVAQSNAQARLTNAVGTYTVAIVASGGTRGDLLGVRVHWRYPNFFAGLTAFFGVTSGPFIEGDATAYFRQEGW